MYFVLFCKKALEYFVRVVSFVALFNFVLPAAGFCFFFINLATHYTSRGLRHARMVQFHFWDTSGHQTGFLFSTSLTPLPLTLSTVGGILHIDDFPKNKTLPTVGIIHKKHEQPDPEQLNNK